MASIGLNIAAIHCWCLHSLRRGTSKIPEPVSDPFELFDKISAKQNILEGDLKEQTSKHEKIQGENVSV